MSMGMAWLLMSELQSMPPKVRIDEEASVGGVGVGVGVGVAVRAAVGARLTRATETHLGRDLLYFTSESNRTN